MVKIQKIQFSFGIPADLHRALVRIRVRRQALVGEVGPTVSLASVVVDVLRRGLAVEDDRTPERPIC